MIGIGIATATAGIIVGVVTSTGFGVQLADVIEKLSNGNVLLMLIMVAGFSLILGMGLPTTANYIVVSSLMTVVIVEVGRQSGLVVPLVAVHLFVFYFGIMADVTPPVGLASFAAAAISGGDPIKTGLTAFGYSLRTALLPFLFIFNTDLLLINVTFWHGVLTFIVAILLIIAFTSITMNYFISKNRWWESLLLLLVMVCLSRPDFVMDRFSPSVLKINPDNLINQISNAPIGKEMMIKLRGENKYGKQLTFYAVLPVEEGKTGEERLEKAGLTLQVTDEKIEYKGKQITKVVVEDVKLGSIAAKNGFDWDQELLSVQLPNPDAVSKEWVYIPAILAFLLIGINQQRRKKREQYV